MPKNLNVSEMSAELQALQRQRAIFLKSRNMQANRLQAIVAGTLGYDSHMPEKDREKKYAEADVIIGQIMKGEIKSPLETIVKTTRIGIDAFNDQKDRLEKEMEKLVKQLPVAAWVVHKDQRGFGLLFLAIVIGETGDLANYANPAKVWRRLGCAPWTFEGETYMGATWRSGKHGKLPASEWQTFGYSPRRRSIAYLIGEGTMKQNFILNSDSGKKDIPGPYRKRYDESKVLFKEKHPDYSDGRCHKHAMLLATKLLLKNLWIEWNDKPAVRRLKPTTTVPV